MKSCFLMGQHDAPDCIQERLCEELERLVRLEGVTEITVGHRGNFDRMAVSAAQRAARRRPELELYLLIAYRESTETVPLPEFFGRCYYPVELVGVPKRWAIVKANRLVLEESDFLITYANREGGNTGAVMKQARRLERKGVLTIINLAQ